MKVFLFELKLALLFVLRRQRGFFNKAKYFTIATVAISVAALLVTLSAFRGYIDVLSARYADSTSDIIVSSQFGDTVDVRGLVNSVAADYVKSTSYFGYLEVIASSKKGIRGIELEVLEKGAFDETVRIKDYLKSGDKNCIFNGAADSQNPGIIIGTATAEILDVKQGDELTVIFFNQNNEKQRAILKICGVYEYGLYDLDSRFAYVSIDTGKALFPSALFDTSIKVKLKDANSIDIVESILYTAVPPSVKVKSWKDINYSMLEAVKMDRVIIFFILSILIGVSIFNVITTLTILIKELVNEVTIFEIIGMAKKRILRLFFFKAVVLGLAGYISGIVLWLGSIYAVERWGIIYIPKDVYLVSKIPTHASWVDLTVVLTVVLLLTSIGALFPVMSLNRKLKKEGLSYGVKGYRS